MTTPRYRTAPTTDHRKEPAMNVNVPRPPGAVPWEEVRSRLDQNGPFANMFDTPLYRDAVWEQFSREEYARRYAALRAKMREHRLDVVIVPGGPSHWSFGGGMTWLTGHWEWHAISSYVVVPLEAEATLIFSMGGTHAEAVRRQVEPALSDVRQSRGGRYAEVMVERIKELRLETPRIGLIEIDPRHKDYMPVNQYNDLRDGLPGAEIVFTKSFIHELVVIKTAAELDCVRKAGVLCQHAMEAMVSAAKPGATESDLRGAAGAAIMQGGGDVDFLIIGSTPMANPAMFFGNPRPSERRLATGDIIIMELAAGYRGYTAQIGSPICVGEPTEMVKKFWHEITLPGYRRIVAEIKPGNAIDNVRIAAKFFRDMGVQSRPTQIHGIDIVTATPHVFAERTEAREDDKIFKPGMVTMAEPNPITADGLFGIFLGHTFIVTTDGHEVVDKFPLELVVA
jgi:Xaa-Pro dipeptidase